MGLDLYHVIPAAKNDESFDYFTLEELEGNPGFLDKYRHLVAAIEDFEQDLEILVFPDAATKMLVLDAQEAFGELPSLTGDINLLKEQLTRIAIDHSFPDKERDILKIVDHLRTEDGLKEIFYHSVSYENAPRTKQVLFYEQKGYQRKGMNSRFCNDFANNKLYFDKAAVIKAYAYLEPGRGNNLTELQENFQVNFIDAFIEGESIFFPGW